MLNESIKVLNPRWSCCTHAVSIDSPVYNVDKSGIPFETQAANIAATKGMKKVRYQSLGKKGQVTIVGCASAAGQVLPLMVIFDVNHLNPKWTKGKFPGTTYGLEIMGGLTLSYLKHGV